MTTDAHAQARAYAQARLDDRLTREHQAWLAAHLAGCAECRRYAAELSTLERLLPETFQARWDSLRPARPNLSAPVPIGGPTMARQKLFNYAGITVGLGALVVLLMGFAFALQTATTGSLVPGQAVEATQPSTAFTPPPMTFTTAVQFGESIVLEGYSLIPGDGVVTVELLWHALATPPADYMVGVFVMADGAQSTIPAQSDSVPAAGTRPTSGWQAGEYVLDTHTLVISSELDVANLVLWVNVYDPQSGDRLRSEPPGGGPFNATAIGSISMPAEPPLTATPLPVPTDGTPSPCIGECTPTPAATHTPCAAGCENLDAILTAVWAAQALTPTPCQAGCSSEPSVDATAAMAATLGWTATPIGFQPSVTPCQAGCESYWATGTAAALAGATGTPLP